MCKNSTKDFTKLLSVGAFTNQFASLKFVELSAREAEAAAAVKEEKTLFIIHKANNNNYTTSHKYLYVLHICFIHP
jgi:hypothetical protein